MTGPDAVICDHVVKIYQTQNARVQAVRGVDLRVPAGTIMAITGPSGSGKSSLLRMISGRSLPSAGSITVAGVDFAEVPSWRRRRLRSRLVAHVEQRPADNLLDHLTVADQVARVARRRGVGVDAADEILDRLRLSHRAAHLPTQLSGGEQQRVAFARAAVGAAPLIVTDEPTAELDAEGAADVLDSMELLAAQGTSILVATHDPRVTERVGRIAQLRDGALASVTSDRQTLAVIDGAGRLQLPPEIRSRFPGGLARLHWSDDDDRLEVERP